jgi:hypothetical protein
VDEDPYFAPLAGNELLPSSFYFMPISQLMAVIFSVSLIYLDGYEYAWWRFVLNSVAILGLLGLLFTTKPYRKVESFSLHVQISLLVVSYMVTLTGFTGTLSTPSDFGAHPRSMNFSTNYTLIGQASSPLNTSMNATSSLPLTGTHARPSVLRFTVALSYITLVVVGFVAIFLIVSFFGALKVGAELERQLNTRSLALKVGTRVVSAGRAVIHSFKSVLRNQKPGLVGTEVRQSAISMKTAAVTGKPPLTNTPRLTRKKSVSRAISAGHGTGGVIETSSPQETTIGENRDIGFAPQQPRKSTTFKRPPGAVLQTASVRSLSVLEKRRPNATIQANPVESMVHLFTAPDVIPSAVNPMWKASVARPNVTTPLSAINKRHAL